MDDADMLLVAQGDSEAFARIVERHQGRLISWFRRMSWGCGSEIEDWSQEVFIRIFQLAPRYVAQGQFVAYLRRTARSVVIDAVRKAKNRPAEQFPIDDDGNVYDPADDFDATESVDTADLYAWVMKYIPEDQRDVAEIYCEGWSLREISEMCDSPVPTIKSRWRLGVQKLQELVIQ